MNIIEHYSAVLCFWGTRKKPAEKMAVSTEKPNPKGTNLAKAVFKYWLKTQHSAPYIGYTCNGTQARYPV